MSPKSKPKKKTKAQLAKIQLKKQLTEWSKLVKVRDDWTCQLCGRTKNLNSHHILSRRHHKNLQLEINNGITLCSFCHKWGAKSPHQGGMIFSEWLKNAKPSQYNWVMTQISSQINKNSPSCHAKGKDD